MSVWRMRRSTCMARYVLLFGIVFVCIRQQYESSQVWLERFVESVKDVGDVVYEQATEVQAYEHDEHDENNENEGGSRGSISRTTTTTASAAAEGRIRVVILCSSASTADRKNLLAPSFFSENLKYLLDDGTLDSPYKWRWLSALSPRSRSGVAELLTELAEYNYKSEAVDEDVDDKNTLRYSFGKLLGSWYHQGYSVILEINSLSRLLRPLSATDDQRTPMTRLLTLLQNPVPSKAPTPKVDVTLVFPYASPRVDRLKFMWRMLAPRRQTFTEYLRYMYFVEHVLDHWGMLHPLGLAHTLLHSTTTTTTRGELSVLMLDTENMNRQGLDVAKLVACDVFTSPSFCRRKQIIFQRQTLQIHPPNINNTNILSYHEQFVKNYRKRQQPGLFDFSQEEDMLHQLEAPLLELDASYCHLQHYLQPTTNGNKNAGRLHIMSPEKHALDHLFTSCNPPSSSSQPTTTLQLTPQPPPLHQLLNKTIPTLQSLTTSLHPFKPNLNPNPTWCPNATCPSSPQCTPCQSRFLILIALRRSGSTSLTHMLHALPNLRMAGENNNQLYAIQKMQQNLETHGMFVFREHVGAWGHGHISPHDFACPAQEMMKSLNPPPRKTQLYAHRNDNETEQQQQEEQQNDVIYGFKTVRFLEKFTSDVYATQFVLKNFPCSKIILNYNSNVDKMKLSPLWKKQAQAQAQSQSQTSTEEELTEMNKRLMRMAKSLGSNRAYLMDLAEWSRNVEKVNDLVKWLGYRGCSFNRLLHYNEGGGLKGDEEEELDLGEECRLVV